MPSQPQPQQSNYDSIGAAYADIVKTSPFVAVEQANLRTVLGPRIKGARVLDLACGEGHFSRLWLEWGASYVLGVDLSAEMIQVARAKMDGHPLIEKGKLEFQVGDAMTLGKIDNKEGEFDIVTGCWLLNYTENGNDMARMFETIAANLKKGGLFVGIVPPQPVSRREMDAFTQRMRTEHEARDAVLGLTYNYYERHPRGSKEGEGDGWRLKALVRGGMGRVKPPKILDEQGEEVDQVVPIDTMHLCCEVYEEAARKGGMTGRLYWKDIERPGEEDIDKYGGSEEYWQNYWEVGPHIGLLVVEKE